MAREVKDCTVSAAAGATAPPLSLTIWSTRSNDDVSDSESDWQCYELRRSEAIHAAALEFMERYLNSEDGFGKLRMALDDIKSLRELGFTAQPGWLLAAVSRATPASAGVARLPASGEPGSTLCECRAGLPSRQFTEVWSKL